MNVYEVFGGGGRSITWTDPGSFFSLFHRAADIND